MARWVLHADLDQFLAAVELLRRPELRGRPVVVGGDGDPTKRAVVSTASYEARALGVRSGLPLKVAVRRCPDCVFLPVDKPHYEAVSAQVMATLKTLVGPAGEGAVVEVIGWDEAFLGVETDDPVGFARELQARVREATQLDVSVGIGPNKLMAKMATDLGKPRGVYTITAADWMPLFGDEPVSRLHGIGDRSAKRLAPLGYSTVRQLAAADDDVLAGEFGPQIGPWLRRIALGSDTSPVVGDPWVARSRSREVTFQEDIADWERVRAEVVLLLEAVLADIADDERPVGRLGVKVRYRNFFTPTRSIVVRPPTRDPAVLHERVQVALSRFTDHGPVRLLGVRAEFERED
ncbi:DNA polymerase IV [Spongisporangium articulatum]|uniref:DNA polymerase IV n=1 Tax=Spongisporangium articulatum TaxID=3362603 RepID=A0ABW8ALI5_9ACTN